MNPFSSHQASLSGPAWDVMPITPDDATDLNPVPPALYVETGGTLSIVTVKGETRTLTVADFSILPVGTLRVRASGTSATGIHGLVVS